ncbi:MAG: SixA phosphatase family protein [Pyrinomonadaceae bacterium]
MKTILLLRHGKSSWADSSLRDFDRPLKDRGLNAAPLIGRFLRKKKIEPDLVISSTAVRARQTAMLVIESAELTCELRFDERIYEADLATLLTILSQLDENANVAMLVGHNPGMENLLQWLTSKILPMPTAALACIDLQVSTWNDVRTGGGDLKWLVTPAELKIN